MSFKRPRAAYEADLHTDASPYVLFGTPLPLLDSEQRDDGSYVPLHQQEVRDEKGRRRMHGAFTGGWSAGYFNTVGSKEGWTPSTFVSSRTNRRKDDPEAGRQRPEDFMDEEDRVDAAEDEKIQTAETFAGLGAAERKGMQGKSITELIRTEDDMVGLKLLRKMGWKDGQGIGPKTRRFARLDIWGTSGQSETGATHLFAPDDIAMVTIDRKVDRKGLGYHGETGLDKMPTSLPTQATGKPSTDYDEDHDINRPSGGSSHGSADKRGGIGTGVLNDTGTDDEDPYEIGPRISYNRTLGGEKKKTKKKKKPSISAFSANPRLKDTPIFASKVPKLLIHGTERCQDGRLPFRGFRFAKAIAAHSMINVNKTYPAPEIPSDWASSRRRSSGADQLAHRSVADVARSVKHDPKTRAAILGEQSLPGKSVFDYLSASARDRVATASGRADLPPARGEIPANQALPSEGIAQSVLETAPKLEKDIAVAAITRGRGGGGPYADDEAKRTRYRAYLEYSAGFVEELPLNPKTMNGTEFLSELKEFYACARLFKPMTGMMATRFTTSSSTLSTSMPAAREVSMEQNDTLILVPPKPPAPAEEAARLGMYGSMTRSIQEFFPTRLLCKRFNVRPPTHVQPDTDHGNISVTTAGPNGAESGTLVTLAIAPPSMDMADGGQGTLTTNSEDGKQLGRHPVASYSNQGLEGNRPSEAVFKAIFGDSSEED